MCLHFTGYRKCDKNDTRVVIVDASGIGSIDITAADRLVSFNKILKDKGLRFI